MEVKAVLRLSFICLCVGGSGVRGPPGGSPALPADVQEKLLEVFSLKSYGVFQPRELQGRNRTQPAIFMKKLYKAMADPYVGTPRGPMPFGSDAVRSYVPKGNSVFNVLLFNLSGLPSFESVIEAEVHIYREAPSPASKGGSYHLIHLYQILSEDPNFPVDSHRLLSVQHVATSTAGWHILNARVAVLDWIAGRSLNMGFLVVVSTPTGDRVQTNEVRLVMQRKRRHPALVLFLRDERLSAKAITGWRNPFRGYPDYYTRGTQEVAPSYKSAGLLRQRGNFSARTCHRSSNWVDFQLLGLSQWIVAPKGYNSHQCIGKCNFPIDQGQKPTNYAQILSAQNLVAYPRMRVRKPSCTPTTLLPLTILFNDDEGNAILRVMEDMTVEFCSCQ